MMRFFVILVTLFMLSCAGGGNKGEQTNSTFDLDIPKPPATLQNDMAKYEYVAYHFWDNFDFADTSYLRRVNRLEQMYATYLSILAPLPSDISYGAMRQMYAKADADSLMFAYFRDLAETYLYDPNSPMRNENLYIPVLESVIDSPNVDSLMKLRPKFILNMALKNRVGDKATDFDFYTIKGQSSSLYKVSSPVTLILFNNPGCEACAEIIAHIKNSEFFNFLIDNNNFQVLALYPDEDIDAWRKYASTIPSEWINAYDMKQELRSKNLYDLKAIPTLYLLDGENKVLMKDAEIQQIESFLMKVLEQQQKQQQFSGQ